MQKILLTKLLSVILLAFLVVGCNQIELGSHVAKKVMPPTKSQGTFKVGNPYTIRGKSYTPQESYTLVETGIASWYGPNFHGKQTANGEVFNQYELTAAHRTLQMPSLVRVTNLENGRSLILRINDRGPFKRGRIIDVSKRAAELLGFKNQGTAKVRVEVLKEESRAVAQAAKQGRDTSGFEVALNRGEPLPTMRTASLAPDEARTSSLQRPAATPSSVPARQPGAVQQETLAAQTPSYARGGAFYSDPVVTQMPVTPTNIYVQAGSFSVQDNAVKLSQNLSRYARADVYPAIVNGRQFYRVRLGPVSNVEQADEILERLINAGNQSAIIVVE